MQKHCKNVVILTQFNDCLIIWGSVELVPKLNEKIAMIESRYDFLIQEDINLHYSSSYIFIDSHLYFYFYFSSKSICIWLLWCKTCVILLERNWNFIYFGNDIH